MLIQVHPCQNYVLSLIKYLAFLWAFKLDLAFLNTGEDEHSPHAYWPTVFTWMTCSCALYIFLVHFFPGASASCYIKSELRKDSVMLQIFAIFSFCFFNFVRLFDFCNFYIGKTFNPFACLLTYFFGRYHTVYSIFILYFVIWKGNFLF